MDKKKIKIAIADRIYPLTVDPAQEESLNNTSKRIDAMIKQFEESYAVRDKQDVLAMCALQFASQLEQKMPATDVIDSQIEEKLLALNEFLSKKI